MAKAANDAKTTWSGTQAYGLAVFCLVLGVLIGYLFRGTAAPGVSVATQAAAADTSSQAGPHDPAQMKAALDAAAAPLLESLKQNPKDFATIVNLGNVYYDAQQYPQAIGYYEQALQIQPDNADVTTDLGTAYWYTGDADKALTRFKKSLKLRPNHPGTLFNMGIVEWQGKKDPAAAVTAWEQLIKTNPDYPQRQQIEDFIAKAKQHMKG